METTFTLFELGQIYATLGVKGMALLSPELRHKLKGEFEQARRATGKKDGFYYATDEPA